MTNKNITAADLEEWKKVFEDASKDPDFKIFTHFEIQIEKIDFDENIDLKDAINE